MPRMLPSYKMAAAATHNRQAELAFSSIGPTILLVALIRLPQPQPPRLLVVWYG